jgi:hypothetical protein
LAARLSSPFNMCLQHNELQVRNSANSEQFGWTSTLTSAPQLHLASRRPATPLHTQTSSACQPVLSLVRGMPYLQCFAVDQKGYNDEDELGAEFAMRRRSPAPVLIWSLCDNLAIALGLYNEYGTQADSGPPDGTRLRTSCTRSSKVRLRLRLQCRRRGLCHMYCNRISTKYRYSNGHVLQRLHNRNQTEIRLLTARQAGPPRGSPCIPAIPPI